MKQKEQRTATTQMHNKIKNTMPHQQKTLSTSTHRKTQDFTVIEPNTSLSRTVGAAPVAASTEMTVLTVH